MCKIEDQIKVVDFVKLIWRLKLWKKIKKTKIVNKELMRDDRDTEREKSENCF